MALSSAADWSASPPSTSTTPSGWDRATTLAPAPSMSSRSSVRCVTCSVSAALAVPGRSPERPAAASDKPAAPPARLCRNCLRFLMIQGVTHALYRVNAAVMDGPGAPIRCRRCVTDSRPARLSASRYMRWNQEVAERRHQRAAGHEPEEPVDGRHWGHLEIQLRNRG